MGAKKIDGQLSAIESESESHDETLFLMAAGSLFLLIGGSVFFMILIYYSL